MPKIIMIVGISGSGKDEVSQILQQQYPGARDFSSEEVRQEKYERSDAKHNTEVFKELENRIIEHLKEGGIAIYNATNIKTNKRTDFLKRVSRHVSDVEKVCVIVGAKIETCLARQQQSKHPIPEEVIRHQCMGFNVPTYREGWDHIEIYITDSGYHIHDLILEASVKEHNNPHHVGTIGEHGNHVMEYVQKVSADPILITAAQLHDIGKIYTETISDQGYSQFKGHGNYGAYITCCSDLTEYNNFTVQDVLEVAFLINYHMDLYNIQTKKQYYRWMGKRKLVGENDATHFNLLHQADLKDSIPDEKWKTEGSKYYGNMDH